MWWQLLLLLGRMFIQILSNYNTSVLERDFLTTRHPPFHLEILLLSTFANYIFISIPFRFDRVGRIYSTGLLSLDFFLTTLCKLSVYCPWAIVLDGTKIVHILNSWLNSERRIIQVLWYCMFIPNFFLPFLSVISLQLLLIIPEFWQRLNYHNCFTSWRRCIEQTDLFLYLANRAVVYVTMSFTGTFPSHR